MRSGTPPRFLTLPASFGYFGTHVSGRIPTVMGKEMPRYSRFILLLASIVAFLSVCPPPQSLVSLQWDLTRCHSAYLLTEFRVAGVDVEVRRQERSLQFCLCAETRH